MKFLSNFDTELEKRLINKYKQTFGNDKVMSIHKSKYYYWRYIGLPLFIYLILLIIGGYFVTMIEGVPERGLRVFLAVFGLYALTLLFRLSRKRMDYQMDFLIVTPTEIMYFEQTGVFDREIEKLHTSKIKSVFVEKPGILNSIFDIGTLAFLSEGNDDTNMGHIVVEYIDAIEAVEEKVSHIIGLDKAEDEVVSS